MCIDRPTMSPLIRTQYTYTHTYTHTTHTHVCDILGVTEITKRKLASRVPGFKFSIDRVREDEDA